MTDEEMFAKQSEIDSPYWYIIRLRKNPDHDASNPFSLKERVDLIKIKKDELEENLIDLEYIEMQGKFPKFREKT